MSEGLQCRERCLRIAFWCGCGLIAAGYSYRPATAIAQAVEAPPEVSDQPPAEAATSPAPATKPLLVGTKHSPPFSIKNPDGSWTGISIELWKHLSDELNLEYQFDEQPLPELLADLEARRLDAAVAAISVTAERAQRMEFCHPHFTTGLGIAISRQNRASPIALLRRIVSTRLMIIVGSMVCVVVICGLLFWLFERRRNESMFGGKRRQGIGMGVWWSTILLLGHKGIIPVSTWGRLLATAAMLASILVLSILTGVIASVLTVQQLDAAISHPSHLRHVRVATVKASTSADYLRNRRISFREYDSPELAMRAVDQGRVDAVVYDKALLRYLARTAYGDQIEVLPQTFNPQEYAIALRPDSTLRKAINEELLRYRASDAWADLTYRYLGE